MSEEELEKWVDDHREETERTFKLWEETQRPGITPKELRKLDRELKKNYAEKAFRVPFERKYPWINLDNIENVILLSTMILMLLTTTAGLFLIIRLIQLKLF